MAPSLASWENGSCNNHILAGGRDLLETDLSAPLVNHKPKSHRRFGLPLVPFCRGLFAVTEIRLADVTDIKWRPNGFGVVVLTNFDKVTINFARYAPDASLRIIQFLRDVLPKSTQQDWNRFCLRIAIPLRNPGSGTRRSEVLFSRAQFDRLLSSVFFADL